MALVFPDLIEIKFSPISHPSTSTVSQAHFFARYINQKHSSWLSFLEMDHSLILFALTPSLNLPFLHISPPPVSITLPPSSLPLAFLHISPSLPSFPHISPYPLSNALPPPLLSRWPRLVVSPSAGLLADDQLTWFLLSSAAAVLLFKSRRHCMMWDWVLFYLVQNLECRL